MPTSISRSFISLFLNPLIENSLVLSHFHFFKKSAYQLTLSLNLFFLHPVSVFFFIEASAFRKLLCIKSTILLLRILLRYYYLNFLLTKMILINFIFIFYIAYDYFLKIQEIILPSLII